MHNDEVRIMDAFVRVAKDWRKMGVQGDRVAQYIEKLAKMGYRSPAEVANGIVRHPNAQEVAQMAKEFQLDQRGLAFATKVLNLINGPGGFIDQMKSIAVANAIATIPDPIKLQTELNKIDSEVADLKKRPYFPFTRFGNHYIVVNDTAGKQIHYETIERRYQWNARR